MREKPAEAKAKPPTVAAGRVSLVPSSSSRVISDTASRVLQCWRDDPASPSPTPPRVGVACMTKDPLAFESWLRHHRDHLGVRDFFVHVEGTPSLAPLLSSPEWAPLVVATYDDQPPGREYYDQMKRQDAHIKRAISGAQKRGVDWLLHIDDDELLFCPCGAAALYAELAAAPSVVFEVHFRNVEARVPLDPGPNSALSPYRKRHAPAAGARLRAARAAAAADPFASCTLFCVEPKRYCAYVNGKSAGRVRAPGLRAHGPHYFAADAGIGGEGRAGTLCIDAAVGAVLHYESASFPRWLDKFLAVAYGRQWSPQALAELPFAYYRESIQQARQVVAALQQEMHRHGGEASVQALRALVTEPLAAAGSAAAHPGLAVALNQAWLLWAARRGEPGDAAAATDCVRFGPVVQMEGGADSAATSCLSECVERAVASALRAAQKAAQPQPQTETQPEVLPLQQWQQQYAELHAPPLKQPPPHANGHSATWIEPSKINQGHDYRAVQQQQHHHHHHQHQQQQQQQQQPQQHQQQPQQASVGPAPAPPSRRRLSSDVSAVSGGHHHRHAVPRS
eukprot:TRINITY_DN14568_c0_g1_i1.p1 TRINITY_DN14568_c0_g1~~TRINITY_DN14568_c0_g1_i1.p1  ORF type:complete len:566 (+),score=178.72 TRINITY_DN14568_c0_g1_i1:94-1791(+)